LISSSSGHYSRLLSEYGITNGDADSFESPVPAAGLARDKGAWFELPDCGASKVSPSDHQVAHIT
jgi:hypothetical protein